MIKKSEVLTKESFMQKYVLNRATAIQTQTVEIKYIVEEAEKAYMLIYTFSLN